MKEYERRRRAVQMVQAGVSPTVIANKLNRSRPWVYKTMARFEEGGLKALHDRSRAPHSQPRAISDSMVKRILSIRQTLQRMTGRRRFAGVGADAIAWELHLRGCKDIPALRTIERVVARAGLTRGKQGRARPRDPRPYPAPVARNPGDVHQCDMIGPRHIATARGPLRFFIYNTVDVAGGGVASLQHEQRTSDTYCCYLVKWVWPRLGIPEFSRSTTRWSWPDSPEGQRVSPRRFDWPFCLGSRWCSSLRGSPGDKRAEILKACMVSTSRGFFPVSTDIETLDLRRRSTTKGR